MARNKALFIVLGTGVLLTKEEEILLVKRSQRNKTFKGFWQSPEGKMEMGEQPDQTIKREIKEELDLEITNSKLMFVKSTLFSNKNVSYHLLRIVMKTEWKGNITLSEENDSYQWIKIEEAIKIPNLVDGTREILKSIEKH